MDLPLRASNEHILIVRVPRAQKIISLHPLPLLAAFFNILLVAGSIMTDESTGNLPTSVTNSYGWLINHVGKFPGQFGLRGE